MDCKRLIRLIGLLLLSVALLTGCIGVPGPLLQSAEIPDGTTAIGESAYANNRRITSITMI